jgi:hypothetical protein
MQDVEVTRRNLEDTRRDFEAQLAAVEARTKHAGGGSAGANADKAKPLKIDSSTCWPVLHHQFKLLLSITTGRRERSVLIF